MKEKITCEYCGKELERKKGKHINHIWSCKKGDCAKKRKKAHREFLRRDVCKIRKRSPNGTRKKPEKQVVPKIGGVKKKVKIPSMFFTKDEKDLLYLKYRKQGLSREECKKRVDEDINYIRDLLRKLRKEEPEIDLNVRFKEEFAKLIVRC
jgi:hypothetical protein